MATAQENLSPHKPARAAMWLYSKRYAAQSGGSMDFWGSLKSFEKGLCRELVKNIVEAPVEA